MAATDRVKRATSRDVARLANVSPTTVSFVINNVPGVNISEETRARVREAAARLDYHPHQAARSLVRRTTYDIGVIIPDATNLHYIDITAGIEAFARSQGYDVVVLATGFDAEREQRGLLWLKQQRIDALLLIDCAAGDAGVLEEARRMVRQGYVITTLGSNFPNASVSSSVVGVGPGERLVLEHLVALGHRRIGYIYGAFAAEIYGSRLHTYLTIQQELDLPVVEGWVRRCGPTPEEAYRATRGLLATCDETTRPTALVVVNDHLAVAVLSALHQAGVRVPERMSVVGFDNTTVAQYTVPPLTTVDPYARTMGEHAAQLTIERLRTPDVHSVYESQPPRLVVRDSTGPAPSP